VPNLKFTADVSAPKPAAVKAMPDSWQALTREELPEGLQALWDKVEASHNAFEDAKHALTKGLTESLKRGKALPAGKVVRLSWKRRFNTVSIGLIDATAERKQKTSGLKFS
jgi:hypothetical protein